MKQRQKIIFSLKRMGFLLNFDFRDIPNILMTENISMQMTCQIYGARYGCCQQTHRCELTSGHVTWEQGRGLFSTFPLIVYPWNLFQLMMQNKEVHLRNCVKRFFSYNACNRFLLHKSCSYIKMITILISCQLIPFLKTRNY